MRRNLFLFTVGTLSMVYGVGKLIQSWYVVPSFVRWHLADIGFVGGCGIAFTTFYQWAFSPSQGVLKLTKRAVFFSAAIGWVVAMTDECYFGRFHGGRFDPIDATCFTASLIVIAIAYCIDPQQEWAISVPSRPRH
jgi:predicted CDP-diglyceride synthetase/phosphatidate cytidylyltransferase